MMNLLIAGIKGLLFLAGPFIIKYTFPAGFLPAGNSCRKNRQRFFFASVCIWIDLAVSCQRIP